MAIDPISIGMAFANTKGGTALLGGLGSGLGSSAPAGPSNAQSGAYGSGLDGSGWNVNFQGVQSASNAQDKSGGVPGFGASGVSAVPWWVWVAGAGLIAWRLKTLRR